jgi:CubicO group peptidase (beta-lactamase class C family)
LLVALVVVTACTSTKQAAVEGPAETRSVAAGLTGKVEEWLGNLYSPGARHVRAVVVSVDEDVVVERYWDSTATTTNDTFSVTKSITGTLAGIALADASLRDVDQPLRELLPRYASDMSPTVASITLRQLLTMTAGLPADARGGGPPRWLFSSDDWVASIVDHGPDHAPGGSFAYSSVTSHLIAAAVDEATPGSLLDYARRTLFEPLGIDTRSALEPPMTDDPDVIAAYEQAGFAWPVDPSGRHVGYAYVKLTPRDMLKLGQLYLDEGQWEGRQVVPAAWVRESTSRQATARAGDLDGYGYHW